LFELPINLVDVIENQFYQRWKMLIYLHCVRALFNTNANAKETIKRVLQKIASTSTTYALALRNFADFVKSRSPF
jgi:hypothetical protein